MIRRRPRIRLVEAERQKMRVASAFNAQLMDFIRPYVKAGITTGEIDRLIHQYTVDHGHIPACLGYAGEKNPFPNSCCTSINDVICHGIPGAYELKDGDIINVDITSIVDGWHGDQSETFIIGSVEQKTLDIVQCAFDCLYIGIEAIEPGCRVSNIGFAIVNHVRDRYDFGIVEKYVGHGIGLNFHQRPNVPHVPNRQSQQERLHPGMCFTIEPMINGGRASSVCDPRDGWTVRTSDGEFSAQFEHTVLMTEEGPEILTTTANGPKPGHIFSNPQSAG